MLSHQPADHRYVDQGFELLELAVDQGAVGPGTGERNIEVIASGFGLDRRSTIGTGRAVRGHPVATLRLFALEFAVIAVFVPPILPLTIDQKSHDCLLVMNVRGTLGDKVRWMGPNDGTNPSFSSMNSGAANTAWPARMPVPVVGPGRAGPTPWSPRRPAHHKRPRRRSIRPADAAGPAVRALRDAVATAQASPHPSWRRFRCRIDERCRRG